MVEPAPNYDGTHPERTIEAAARILAPVFEQNEWRWATSKFPSGIPNEEEIAEWITRLVSRVRDDTFFSASGRIVAMSDNVLPGQDGVPEEIHIYLDLGTIYTKPQI